MNKEPTQAREEERVWFPWTAWCGQGLKSYLGDFASMVVDAGKLSVDAADRGQPTISDKLVSRGVLLGCDLVCLLVGCWR